MKQIAETSPLIVSEGLTSSVMGIDPENAARITKYLRDSIYSDKVLATVRETVMNSIDEHLQHGVLKEVEIGVRQEGSEYEFFARDFALGLSEKDVREVFGMYGSSTKRNTNSTAGQYGIGSLAPFSYSDSFFVVSHFKGNKTTYSCALGGDTQNVSVGHIFKIDECPTIESGLEVIVPIKKQDFTDFSEKIRNFVVFSPYPVKANILGDESVPNVPVYEKKVDNYNFRLIESDYFYNQKVLFQMGGNTYEYRDFDGPSCEKIKKNHCLVVDIPIGTCSITLSREAFEKTEKNSRVFSEIEEILNTLATEDLAQFKTKNTRELIEDSLSQMKHYAGNIFQASAESIYKNVWGFVSSVSKSNNLPKIESKLGKPICVLIPNNDAKNYWKQKVRGFLSDVQQNMYIAVEAYSWASGHTEITDYFTIVSARKLPYPKVKKEEGRFAVYHRSRRQTHSLGKFNALEFFNVVSEQYNWKFRATTEKEASDFLVKKISGIKQISDLEHVSFVCGPFRDSSMFMIGSEAFAKKLEEIGFIRVGSKQWKDTHSVLIEKKQKEQEIERTVSSAKKNWCSYGPKTIEIIEKPRHAEKIGAFWTAVLSEDSLRGKLLKSLNSRGYYNDTKLNRDELRKVLKLV